MALHKAYTKTTNKCKVTFELPAQATEGVKKVALVGDFNNWETRATMMKKNKDGLFAATVTLEPGHEYQFRYLMDDCRWENDWHADKYEKSLYGDVDNSVVIV